MTSFDAEARVALLVLPVASVLEQVRQRHVFTFVSGFGPLLGDLRHSVAQLGRT